MSTSFKVAGVQLDIRLADKASNLVRMQTFLKSTTAAGARLTVFPECALTGYCFDSLDEAREFAEPIPGPSTQAMQDTCRELGTLVVYGMLESDGEQLYNSCVLVGENGVLGSYRKIHLPYLGIDRFVTPGDRPFSVHQADELKLGMNICYDGAFPESSRVMALDGADLVVLPTNWPPGAECFAEFVINARAMENQIYYMAVNRVGVERGFQFLGYSKICDPSGNTLQEARHTEEAVLMAELDLQWPRNKHLIRVRGKHEIHRFADRRPEMYSRVVDPVEHSSEYRANADAEEEENR